MPNRPQIEAAFTEGDLYLLIDKPRPHGGRLFSAFVGDREVTDGTPLVLVHVMSKPARGEIRGYIMTPDGALRLRLPEYTGHWPALDAAVLARVPGAKAVAPYTPATDGAVRP